MDKNITVTTIENPIVKKPKGFQPGNTHGRGRPPGSPNKANLIRDDLLGLFTRRGGVQLLEKHLEDHPNLQHLQHM